MGKIIFCLAMLGVLGGAIHSEKASVPSDDSLYIRVLSSALGTFEQRHAFAKGFAADDKLAAMGLDEVGIHQLGHALGFSTLWGDR